MIGTKLGPYTITAKLGEGGMGEVYRATDSKLKRDVAIKVLPALFTEDRERLARFEREAQLLAQLHHPNIASVFGLEDGDRTTGSGVRALVMELVDGEDLSTLIARGAMPLDDALAIARQIAEALEAAHEQGIVHRDLKPANVKVRADGAVKVLDFGLAKALDASTAMTSGGPTSSPTLMNSPTLTSARATQLGMILGTAAYMAPEQARGKAVDKRADIWAFGVVLFEMLSGKRAFAGEETSDVLAAVLRQEIDWHALPPSTPTRLRRLLERCLERDPKQRLRDVGEARVEISKIESGAPDSGLSVDSPATVSSSHGWRTPIVVIGAATAVAVAALAAWTLRPMPPAPTIRLSIALPPGEQVTTAPAISPDGQTIAYVAGRSPATARLYLRGLNDFTARPVDSGSEATWPFFSPDGRSIAFFANGKLRRAPVGGGAATTITTAPRAFGGTWGADGSIIYSPMLNSGLWRVNADGGTPEQLTKPDAGEKGYAHVFPQTLPNGEVLFTLWGKRFGVQLLALGSRTWRPVTGDGKDSRVGFYAGDGFLLRADNTSDLLAGRWTPQVTTPVAPESVALHDVFWMSGTDKSWIAVAANGTAVYAPGSPSRRRLVWVDRSGNVSSIPGVPDLINAFTLSRDGRRAVYNGRNAVWMVDLANGGRTRLLSDITWAYPGGWFPGDERFAFSTNTSGEWELYAMRPTGGDPALLLHRPGTQHPMDVGPDGSVVFADYGDQTGIDLWMLTPQGETHPLVVTPFQDWGGVLSPDGRVLAYVSDASGRNDVYALPLLDGRPQGDPTMISVDGGTGPAWSRDGRELFYRAGDDLISLDVRSTGPLALGERRRVLDLSPFEPQYFHDFQVAPDGQHFLLMRADADSRPTRLDVILNWLPELAEKVGSR